MEEEKRFLTQTLRLDRTCLGFLLWQPGLFDAGGRAQLAKQAELRHILPCVHGLPIHISHLSDQNSPRTQEAARHILVYEDFNLYGL